MHRWYHMDSKPFHPDWDFPRWKSFAYTPDLLDLQLQVAAFLHVPMNSLLINYYASGRNVISRHRDKESVFGENPTVAIVSLGATRRFRFTPVSPDSVKSTGPPLDYDLVSGSLLVMSGTTQKYYLHELLRDASVTTPRCGLTFRRHQLG